jgi:hypothetical protein
MDSGLKLFKPRLPEGSRGSSKPVIDLTELGILAAEAWSYDGATHRRHFFFLPAIDLRLTTREHHDRAGAYSLLADSMTVVGWNGFYCCLSRKNWVCPETPKLTDCWSPVTTGAFVTLLQLADERTVAAWST